MSRKPGDVERLLCNKFGFARAAHHSSNHRWFELTLPGLPTIFTKVSQGRKDIDPGIESKIAKQIKVRKPFYNMMMDCTRSREDYYAQVTKDPYPPWP